MPLDATRNSLVLPILGLLVEQPDHAYDITSRLRARYPQVKTRRSTVVTLLKSLNEGGLLVPGPPEIVSNRPTRISYRLTEEGIWFFRSRVRQVLAESVPASVDFVMAVAYLGILPKAEAISVLRARAERLRGETPVIPPGLPEMQMIEVYYWLRVLATEIRWLTETAERLAHGDLEVLA